MLKDSAELVRDFLLRQFNEDGGRRPHRRSDLYYTVFGIDGLIALQAELRGKIGSYVRSFGTEFGFRSISVCRARAAASLQNEKPNGAIVQRISVSLSRWRL